MVHQVGAVHCDAEELHCGDGGGRPHAVGCDRRTGPLRGIHSDRAKIFTGEVFRNIFETFDTRLSHTTAWHPEGDGQTEIYNKHLVAALRATLAAGGGDTNWVELLPFCAVEHRLHATRGLWLLAT